MTDQLLATPNLLPINESLQQYLTSSIFLTKNIWKIVFSPCSQYLAIPKQDIDGQDCVVVIHCPDWQADAKTAEFKVHGEFLCSSTIWSLAFGQRTIEPTSLNENSVSTPITRRELLARHHSNLSSVNRRYDLSKNLFLAIGLADGEIHIWNVDTKELTLVLKDHKTIVSGLAFKSNTMQLASCSHDTTIKLWDLCDDGNMYKTLNEWTHVIKAVKWSPDEKLLCAVGLYELVVLYNTKTWKELFKFEGHLHSVVDCAFSSDSALLATASYDTHVLLWSTVTGELLKDFAHKIPVPLKIYAGGDNGSFIRNVIFTKYDRFLITICDDNKIRWFSIESTRPSQALFERTQNNILCLSTTSDEKTMAIGTRTGEVHLLSTLSTRLTNKPPSLKKFCRRIINRQSGLKRQEIVHLLISQSLINYLLYKDIKVKSK